MTNLTHKRPECVELLFQLKSTVDELLASCRVDVLNIYGGLERLVVSINSIISHQYKANKDTNGHDTDVWSFLYEVFLIKPCYAQVIQAVNKSNRSNRSMMWIKRSILSYTLSQQLTMLLEHKEVIQKYYTDDCFLLQPQFSSALLTCLRAIERNDPSLLAEVNLLKLSSESSSIERSTRSSLSISHDSTVCSNSKGLEGREANDSCSKSLHLFHGTSLSEPIQNLNGHVDASLSGSTSIIFSSNCNQLTDDTRIFDTLNNCIGDSRIEQGLKRKDDLHKTSDGPSMLMVDPEEVMNITKRDEPEGRSSEPLSEDPRMKNHIHCRSASDISLFLKSPPDEATAQETQSDKVNVYRDKKTHQRHYSYFFKQPKEGQSLISFFMSHNFNSCTDLDRENAHFNFAETLLSVIEQVKWNQIVKSRNIKSDEKVDLMQRIRIRKKVGRKQLLPEVRMESEGSLTSGSEESFHGDDVDDSSLSEFNHSNLQIIKENGVSLSLASLYSDADFRISSRKGSKEQADLARSDDSSRGFSPLSADIIAIKLLKNFSNHLLPKASDVVWPHAEDDISSDKVMEANFKNTMEVGEESDSKQLRGSHEWAPPRPQIIVTIHEKPKLLHGLLKQNNRCAGCGSVVERSYAKRYIFCEYLGKYFCPCCHNNSKSIIPARILIRWDFSLYPISHFAHDFLCKNRHEPWFNVSPELYRKVSILNQIKQCRFQLYYLRQFIQVCQNKDRPKEILNCPPHWFVSINNIDSFSLIELEMVKNKQFLPELQEKADTCLSHIKQCFLCQARGFICEVCRKADDIIFPFEIQRVTICQSCKASFHKQCFNPNSCPKCARLLQRRKAWVTS